MTDEQKIVLLTDPKSCIAIASVVYWWRISGDWTREELSEKTGISADRLEKLERPVLDSDPFTPEEIDRIAVALFWMSVQNRFPTDMDKLENQAAERLAEFARRNGYA